MPVYFKYVFYKTPPAIDNSYFGILSPDPLTYPLELQ